MEKVQITDKEWDEERSRRGHELVTIKGGKASLLLLHGELGWPDGPVELGAGQGAR